MKSLLAYLCSRKITANIFLKFLLRLDNLNYKLISTMSIAYNNGQHPKHNILKYYDWFISKVDKNSTVLDIGCNKGGLLKVMANHIKFGYGMDINSKYIDEAKNTVTNKNIEFIHADASRYNFKQFVELNIITLSNVLEHIDDRVKILKDIIHSLDGRKCKILIRVPLITRDWLSCFKKNLGIEYRLDQTHFIEYTEEEIFTELASAGIEVINHEVRFGEIYLECSVNN